MICRGELRTETRRAFVTPPRSPRTCDPPTRRALVNFLAMRQHGRRVPCACPNRHESTPPIARGAPTRLCSLAPGSSDKNLPPDARSNRVPGPCTAVATARRRVTGHQFWYVRREPRRAGRVLAVERGASGRSDRPRRRRDGRLHRRRVCRARRRRRRDVAEHRAHLDVARRRASRAAGSTRPTSRTLPPRQLWDVERSHGVHARAARAPCRTNKKPRHSNCPYKQREHVRKRTGSSLESTKLSRRSSRSGHLEGRYARAGKRPDRDARVARVTPRDEERPAARGAVRTGRTTRRRVRTWSGSCWTSGSKRGRRTDLGPGEEPRGRRGSWRRDVHAPWDVDGTSSGPVLAGEEPRPEVSRGCDGSPVAVTNKTRHRRARSPVEHPRVEASSRRAWRRRSRGVMARRRRAEARLTPSRPAVASKTAATAAPIARLARKRFASMPPTRGFEEHRRRPPRGAEGREEEEERRGSVPRGGFGSLQRRGGDRTFREAGSGGIRGMARASAASRARRRRRRRPR